MVRGAALAAMAVYHFSWDLGHFGFHDMDVAGDLGWRIFARLIAGTFLFLVGASLVLAHGEGMRWRAFWRRVAVVVVAAAAVSAVTWFVFPQYYVRFGILHHIALASILALPFLRLPLALVVASAALASVVPAMATGPAFGAPALVWLGLSPSPPPAADYVPLFPYFGLVLAGVASARLVRGNPSAMQQLARANAGQAGRIAAWAGRHSLAVYLIHQPVLFGLVYSAALAFPQPGRIAAVDAETFLASCRSECDPDGGRAILCRSICACAADKIDARDLWPAVTQGSEDIAGRRAAHEIIAACVAEAGGPSDNPALTRP